MDRHGTGRRGRRVAASVEPVYQDLAIAAMQEALQGSLSEPARLRATYQLADLLRRRGRPEEARPLYAAVLSDAQTPSNIREMAELLVSGLPPR